MRAAQAEEMLVPMQAALEAEQRRAEGLKAQSSTLRSIVARLEEEAVAQRSHEISMRDKLCNSHNDERSRLEAVVCETRHQLRLLEVCALVRASNVKWVKMSMHFAGTYSRGECKADRSASQRGGAMACSGGCAAGCASQTNIERALSRESTTPNHAVRWHGEA
jgi:hypothetical protein